MGKDTEHDLVLRTRSGDEEAFARLVENYQRPIYNLCYRMLGDPAEAEEAAQETFLKAFQNIERFDLERSFVNWILSIGSNHCVDQLRRRRFEWLDLSRLVDRKPAPEERVEQAEQEEVIRHLLAELKAEDRAVIVLKYWHDMRIQQIAGILELKQGAVKTRLHRARKRLAQELLNAGVQPERRRDEPRAI